MEERIYIRTDDEMIQDYGDDWASSVQPRWNRGYSMEHLHGLDITEQITDVFSSSNVETLVGWIKNPRSGAHTYTIKDGKGSSFTISTKHCRVGPFEEDNSLYKVKQNGLFAKT